MHKIERLQCIKCKHVWVPRSSEVKQCPSCRTLSWTRDPRFNFVSKIELTDIVCDRCGYKWKPRVPNTRKCPSCKNVLTTWKKTNDIINRNTGDTCDVHSEGD